MTTTRRHVVVEEKRWSSRLTPRYVADIINHVAALHLDKPLVVPKAAEESLGRYVAWRDGRFTPRPELDYGEFAAFFARELTRGDLGATCDFQTRVRIALDFITHVLLENNLMSRDWRIECKQRAALRALLHSEESPDLILKSLRLCRW